MIHRNFKSGREQVLAYREAVKHKPGFTYPSHPPTQWSEWYNFVQKQGELFFVS